MKKAQAAMEFLMTYGWAILVVLIAIGALAYFGVLTPNKMLPEVCIFYPGLSCDDFKVASTGEITLIITNGLGKDLSFLSITISGENGKPCVGNSAELNNLKNGESKKIIINCDIKPEKGSAFRETISLTYITNEGYTHIIDGKIISKVE